MEHIAAADTGDRRRPIAATVMIWTAVAAIMAVLALANPTSRDEAAFVGPAAVAANLRPYVDFLYLQTPLQGYLIGPFARLFPGHAFIALRLATGLAGAAVLAIVYVAQRGLGVSRQTAAGCTALLACCYSFQFGFGVVRNDALPALMAVAATQFGLLALRGRICATPAWLAAGLLLGAAASVKLSYAFPAAGAGLFLAAERLRGRASTLAVAACALGGLVGLIPCLIAWRAAPDGFVFSAYQFNASTLIDWYRSQGRGWVANPAANVLVTLVILATGPALGTLWLLANAAVRKGWAAIIERSEVLWLDVLILSGLVAAVLPTPSNFQYALPALPALFIRLGVDGLQRLRSPGRMDRAAAGLMAVGIVAGVGYGVLYVATSRAEGDLPAVGVTQRAHWIGERLRASTATGFISTLSPLLVLDSGFRLDPRFSTGVFVYRAGAQLSLERLGRLKTIGPANLSQALDQNPPAAIVVGGEKNLDDALRQYAIAHGYRREHSPFRTVEVDIRVVSPSGTPARPFKP